MEMTALGCSAANPTIEGAGEAGAPRDATADSVSVDALVARDADKGGRPDARPKEDTGADDAHVDAAADTGTGVRDGAADGPVGCTPDPTVCPRLGVSDCTGWDCDGGLTQFGGDVCARAGEGSAVPGDTAYACGPNWIGGNIGDPAGNGCVQFAGNWCDNFGSPRIGEAGILTYEYACPSDGGPPAKSACVDVGPGWCCDTHPSCFLYDSDQICAGDNSSPQTYLAFGGAIPLGCTPLTDASSPLRQTVVYCCPVSTDGGPECQL
jgi:hypothetical protein